jgi:hypothetical protein
MQVFRVLVVITAFSLAAVSSVAAQGRSGAHRPTLPTQAQAGKGAAHVPQAGEHPGQSGDAAKSPKANRGSDSTSIPSDIAKNPKEEARLKAMLPSGMTLEDAAKGFRNRGQFTAALEASKNQNIPFADLKREMTGPDQLSLGQAIDKLRPAT